MRPLLLPLVVSALALTSCLEIEDRITLAADGSGTQKFVLRMSEGVLAKLRRSKAAMDASFGATDPEQLFEKDVVRREFEDAGLELVAHRSFEERRHRCVEIEAKFAGLDGLRASPLSGPHPEWRFVRGAKAGTINVIFYPTGRDSWLRARKQAAELQGELDPTIASFFEKRRAELRDIDLQLELKLPGAVLACSKNLTETGTDAVTARVRAEDIRTPSDLVLALAPRYEVLVDGRQCTFALEEREVKPAKVSGARD